jgi:HSP20 family protein
MKKRTYNEKAHRKELAIRTLAVVLLLGGGAVWAEKHDGKIQLKKDDPTRQEPKAQEPLPRLNPFRDLVQMQREMDRLFGSTLLPYSGFPEFDAVLDQNVEQAMDLRERSDVYVLQMDLPGLDKSDIVIEVVDHVLTVSGERKESVEKKDGEKILMQERSSSAFRREVMLPKSVDADKVVAVYKAGVLTITLPKTEQDKGVRKIEIK